MTSSTLPRSIVLFSADGGQDARSSGSQPIREQRGPSGLGGMTFNPVGLSVVVRVVRS
jgi:hypothetical protein